VTRPGYTPARVVEVHCWDRFVGAVALNPSTGYYAFEYAPDWLASGIELAPLHTPLRPGPVEYADLPEGTYHRLPALLADALPDAFGNALVNAWMAERGVAEAQITPLDRLAYAGDRAVGALTFRPPAALATEPSSAVQLADLVVAARGVIRGDFTDGATMADALHQLIQVGTSAGGARAKAVIAWNPTTNQVRSGQHDAPEGFEHWLIKLDGVSSHQTGPALDGSPEILGDTAPYGRIEYAYHLMATAAGVEMVECRLLPEGPRTHFLTRRFDRPTATGRHHVLTLCAMAHLDFRAKDTHSYAQYLQTVQQLGLDRDALAQAYRRMVFNVVAVNRDDHTKNLAFLLPQGGRWQLAPAYDVTYAFNPHGEWTQRHQLSVNGLFDRITVKDLWAVGEQFAVPGYKRIVREVIAAVADWPSFAAAAGLGLEHTARIAADLAEHRPA
jgi:serine/threonine-protein kinase HipA